MTTWVFARHGQSIANAQTWMSGHTDVPLTELGRDQARALGAAVRALRLPRVVSSDLERAYETATLALGERTCAVRRDPRLRERDLGAWTGITMDRLHAIGGHEALGSLDGRPPGGESLRDVALRVLAVLDALDDGVPTMVVAHGGVLRAVLGLLDARPAVRVQKAWVPNAAPHVRVVTRGSFGVLREAVRTAPYGGSP